MKKTLVLVGVLAVGALLVAALAGCSPTGSGTATGGGWVPSKACDGKATFGFKVAYDNDSDDFKGNLSYTDHNYPMGDYKMINLHGKVTGGGRPGATTWAIGTYQPKPKGEPGKFTVWLTDEGQPQEGDDTFKIELEGGSFGGYDHSGVLGGGNVVLRISD